MLKPIHSKLNEIDKIVTQIQANTTTNETNCSELKGQIVLNKAFTELQLQKVQNELDLIKSEKEKVENNYELIVGGVPSDLSDLDTLLTTICKKLSYGYDSDKLKIYRSAEFLCSSFRRPPINIRFASVVEAKYFYELYLKKFVFKDLEFNIFLFNPSLRVLSIFISENLTSHVHKIWKEASALQ